MWPDTIPATNAALVWFLFTIPLFIFAHALAKGPAKRLRDRFGRSAWLFLPLVALIVRLVPAIVLPVGAGYDIESFQLTGEALLSGEDVYTSAAVGRHPYVPFQVYFIGLATFFSQLTGLPFAVLVKMLPIAADVIIVGLIFHIAIGNGWSRITAWSLALMYALNPVSLLVSAYHGQFDSIPMLLLLTAWYFWHFGQHLVLSSLALGLAILSKTWPVVFLPIILVSLKHLRSAAIYGLIALGVPFLLTTAYVLVFHSDPEPMLRRALTHTGNPGWWGISDLLTVGGFYMDSLARAAQEHWEIRRWLLILAGILALWRTRRQSRLDALVTVILVIIAITAGIGMQWLLWVVPFAIVARDNKWQRVYSLIASLFFLLPHLYGLHMVPPENRWFPDDRNLLFMRLVTVPVWSVVVLWLVARWRKVSSGR
jgi:hypothetical protein